MGFEWCDARESVRRAGAVGMFIEEGDQERNHG